MYSGAEIYTEPTGARPGEPFRPGTPSGFGDGLNGLAENPDHPRQFRVGGN